MGKNNSNKPGLVSAPNYGREAKWPKIKRKINGIIVSKIANTALQFKFYKSYWHYRLFKNNISQEVDISSKKNHYLTQKPNYGAGIGHQLANWNAGLYFADYFKLKYAHSPFSNQKWELFFGFGENEVKSSDLKSRHYKIVRLPKFNSQDQREIDLVGNIIKSYKKNNILFTLETDQGYMRQFETTDILTYKFFNAPARVNDKLIFAADHFNIAIHIRRRMSIETDEVWKDRGLDNNYYVTILKSVLKNFKTEKKIAIYLFSQGVKDDFPEFDDFKNINYCMDMGPVDSFLHMVYADLLISCKSSFSYKPALISKGIKISPKTFWHGYPQTKNYVLADNDGNFDIKALLAVLKH